MAVSKTYPVPVIAQAVQAGQLDLGENKVQEIEDKKDQLAGVRWHMIGHLQRNKVKYIAPYVHLIHSIDSLDLLKEVDKQGTKAGRTIPVLLQVHIAKEETKYGLERAEVETLLQNPEVGAMRNIEIRGLMGMATNTDDATLVREEFKGLRRLFEECRTGVHLANARFEELSMGMSQDWEIAAEEGSTMVRMGSAIFGARS